AAARALMSDHMCSGYGVRTLSAAEKAYHPLSYHRGTVWPHDNALIALGLVRRGRGDAAARIAAGLFAAASFDRDRRLPELFGGCPAGMEGPAWYPVARTLSSAEKAYHPLSYHRGTVWPHDNALIALGLVRRGRGDAAARIAAGLFAAASFDRDRRLPELFGGCPAGMEGPAWYPVAC